MSSGPHWVKIRLIYLTNEQTGKRYPYKWKGECVCGWGCISWSWWREWDLLASGLTREEWVEENGGEPMGGALVMSLDHLGLYSWSKT